MRVAFDIDGVLADMNAGLARVAAELYPSPDGAPMQADAVSASRQQARVWDRIRRQEDFWESLDEIESGAVARLAAIAGERNWHVLFLTQRPETTGSTAQVQSQRWLRRRGFDLPSVCITRGSRGKIARALDLDVMVDDRRDNCLDIRGESDTRVILVERSGDALAATKAGRLGIECVSGAMAALDLLDQTAP